jgi:hypothetical protein
MMGIDELRQAVQKRPFKSFEIHVDNGEKYLIEHPENVFITPQLVVTVDKGGRTILISPETVSTVGMVDAKRRRNGRRRR